MKSSKKKALMVTLGAILMVVTIGITYAFITQTLAGTKKITITAGLLSLVLGEKNEITITDALPMYDEVGMIQEKTFDFYLINSSANPIDYTLKLSKIDADNELAESDVKYYLTKEGVGQPALLSTLIDGVIDTGTLAGNETIDYSLRLWIDAGVTDNSAISGKSLSYKIVVEAQIATDYAIFFDANDGSDVTTKIFKEGEMYGELPTLTRKGYTFNGWYTSEDELITASTIVDTLPNDTLYAKWTMNKVSIKYNVNGGTIQSTTSSGDTTYTFTTDTSGIISRAINEGEATSTIQTINYGGTLSSSGLVDYNGIYIGSISKTGYKAVSGAEWICLSGDCVAGTTYSQATAYEASAFCDTSVNDCTVVLGVNWSINNYTITFNANGGSVSTTSKSVTYASTYGTLPTPTRTRYTFNGWYTASSGGTKVTSTTKVSITANQTLYAQWTANTVAGTKLKSLKTTGYNSTAYNGMYRYIGTSANNYAKLGNVLYRIVGITSAANSTLGLEANQLKVVKATAIGSVVWDSDYTKDTAPNGVTFQNSEIRSYLQGSNILSNTSVIPSGWSAKIDSVKWYQGYCQTDAGVSTVISCEKSSVTSSSYKIGLLYLSDYYYSIPGGASSSTGYYKVENTSWIGSANWMLTRYGYHDDGYWSGWHCSNSGCRRPGTNGAYAVRPSFYLLPNVTYVSGTGTSSNPFILE